MRKLSLPGFTPIIYYDRLSHLYLYLFTTCSVWLCGDCHGAINILMYKAPSECFVPLVKRCECHVTQPLQEEQAA